MVTSDIEPGGESNSPSNAAGDLHENEGGTNILDQARAVVDHRAAKQLIDEAAYDKSVIDHALKDAVESAQTATNKRAYLRKLLEDPELDLLRRESPPLETFRHRGDLDGLFWAKLAMRYAQYRQPTNTLWREVLRRIAYNYLYHERDVQTAASELLDDPTSEIPTLNYQIETARQNNYRTVLGPKQTNDLDEIRSLYDHLRRTGAEPDLNRLPTLLKLEAQFRSAAPPTAESAAQPLPITTEGDINRLLSIALRHVRSRNRNEQATDVSPLITSDELDQLLSNILHDET